jgi:5-hydroxyisourate hydrolase
MSAITTHILDLSQGRPAQGVEVVLEFQTASDTWTALGKGVTDADGRLKTLLAPDHPLQAGQYRITFVTGSYFAEHNIASFYPEVSVTFFIQDTAQHYHVPLLVSPFGYSTYRGS